MSALIIITFITLITTVFCDMTAKPHMSSELAKPENTNLTTNSSSTISSSLFTEGGITNLTSKQHSTEASNTVSINNITQSVTTEPNFVNSTINTTHVHKISSRKDVKFDNNTDTKVSNNSIADDKATKNNVNQLKSTTISLNVTTTISSPVPINVTVTTLKPIPKKPLITIGDEEPYAPSNFQPKESKTLLKNNSDVKMDNVQQAPQRHNKNLNKYEPDYVVPVVITILSIPLLIGFMMLMFKLGTHWWDRRHYRRMDYLIEGMYNN